MQIWRQQRDGPNESCWAFAWRAKECILCAGHYSRCKDTARTKANGTDIVEGLINNTTAESGMCYKVYKAGRRSKHYLRTLSISLVFSILPRKVHS